VKALLELFTQMAATAFCKESVAGMELHAALVGVSGLAIATNTHVPSCHAFHLSGLIVENFGGSEARKNLHA
jgi:hypothetical protein